MHTVMLGYAWQKGLVPISAASLMDAISANGVAVAMQRSAFQWGRVPAANLQELETAVGLRRPAAIPGVAHIKSSFALKAILNRQAP